MFQSFYFVVYLLMFAELQFDLQTMQEHSLLFIIINTKWKSPGMKCRLFQRWNKHVKAIHPFSAAYLGLS